MERLSTGAKARLTWLARLARMLAGLVVLGLAAAFCALQCLFAWINISMYPGGG